jgi:hypothetical protein
MKTATGHSSHVVVAVLGGGYSDGHCFLLFGDVKFYYQLIAID